MTSVARALRPALCATLLSTFVAAGCGGNPTEGLVSNLDKARNARVASSLQVALTSLSLMRSQSGGDYPAAAVLVNQLPSKDPTNRYTTQPVGQACGEGDCPGIVQVLGGGQSIMLVGINSPLDSPRSPFYSAIWTSTSGATEYYLGHAAPQYTLQPPQSGGWSTMPQTSPQ